ncbi:MAG: hydrogenase nickel incorporation protein HypB [Oscillospiraceae bacterium]|jgi:hydrogenase nickel incorporation protein HypB
MEENRIRIIELKESVLENNDADAERLREELRDDGTYFINLMSSPGSGKTTVLRALLPLLRDKGFRCGVMEADIDSDVDARTLQEAGWKAIQLHTGGMCHLDAQMSRQGLDGLGTGDLDVVFLENVGNLVCPAEFDTGAHLCMVILAVPEGDDKPLKYPLMFEKSDIAVINKIDSAPAFDFDMDRAREGIRMRNPEAAVFPVSGKTGQGISGLADEIADRAFRFLGRNGKSTPGFKTIDLSLDVNAANDDIASEIRRKNSSSGLFLVNVMASPGAGKSSVLLRTAGALRGRFGIGVMEADIDSAVDAEKLAGAGVRTIQVHTGGECAMDAAMTRDALREFDLSGLDIVFLENVGNLVCPAENDVGASLNVEILSVPEGDDKPLKYPLMFRVCDAVIINKIDTREFFSFDDEAAVRRIHALNPEAEVFFLSAKTGEGFQRWTDWLAERVENSRKAR